MKPITRAILASIAALGLISACSDDKPVTAPTASGLSPDEATLPDGATIPSFPTDFSLPQEQIDLMIQQFEAAGMKVDRACFTELLSDPALRQLASAGAGATPSPDLIQKFLTCMST